MTYSREAVLQALDVLNDIGAPYIVTGSLARNLYAAPRSTNDADFVVDMDPRMLEQFFFRLGEYFEREPQMAFETVTGKLQHKFRFRQSPFLIEVFEANFDDPHERARFDRRKPADVEGRTATVTTAEDVIVQKLRWFKQIRRVKDRQDVKSILIEQWPNLDWQYIEQWCGGHGSLELLNEFKREVEAELKRQ